MRRPSSLTLRLTLLFGIAAAIVFSGLGWFIERSIDRHFSTEDMAELEVIYRTVAKTLTTNRSVVNSQILAQRFSDILVGHHGAVLHVVGRDGRTLFASPGGPNLVTLTSSAHYDKKIGSLRRWSDDNHVYSVLTKDLHNQAVTDGSADYTISVAVAIDSHLRFLDKFRRTLWLMITSGILLMGIMGWIAVRQGHAPLHNIVNQIRHISASELNTRIPPETVPRELNDLAVSFNEMLGRMEEAFQKLSNFSADIAHELRTPITALLTQTQVALSQPRNVDEYREILYSNMEEYERMAQMIADMLFLAKADNGLYELNTVSIDLTNETLDLFEYYGAWAEERDISLVLEGNARASGDRLMIRRLLSNLLSNAIRHTPPNNTVHVLLQRTSSQTVSINVENPGIPIPAEHIPRLFDRFYRVDASRQRDSEGVGLGLAIAKSIVDIHGGNIEVESSEKNTRFRIILPG